MTCRKRNKVNVCLNLISGSTQTTFDANFDHVILTMPILSISFSQIANVDSRFFKTYAYFVFPQFMRFQHDRICSVAVVSANCRSILRLSLLASSCNEVLHTENEIKLKRKCARQSMVFYKSARPITCSLDIVCQVEAVHYTQNKHKVSHATSNLKASKAMPRDFASIAVKLTCYTPSVTLQR